MFADTCHSGGAYNSRLVNDAANANIIVFSATDTETLSWEFDTLAHGAFTYALIEGLEGRRADPMARSACSPSAISSRKRSPS